MYSYRQAQHKFLLMEAGSLDQKRCWYWIKTGRTRTPNVIAGPELGPAVQVLSCQ